MEIKPDRLIQCARYNKCPTDYLYAQEYAYLDVITIKITEHRDYSVIESIFKEIFITTHKEWREQIINYWDSARDAYDHIKEITHGWEVIEGSIEI